MLPVNDHCHSSCSPDGSHTMKEMALAGLEAGLAGICFTDHCDLLSEQGEPAPDALDWAAETAQFAEAEEAMAGRLPLRLGIELGQPTQMPEAARQVLRHPFDFVIGSVHNPVGDKDYYYHTFSDAAACRNMLHAYCLQNLDLARSDLYDVIGHIGYPLRYMRWRDGVPVSLLEEREVLETLLRTVIERGRGIELNTSGYLNCGGAPIPDRTLLELYRSLGGEIITLGSDAHVPERMRQGLDDGMELLRSLGFRYIASYRARKPVMLPL